MRRMNFAQPSSVCPHLFSFSVMFIGGPALAVQAPRPPVLVEHTLFDPAAGPSIASRDDLSVLAFADGGPSGSTNRIRVSRSDGRAITYSTPVRIDSGPPATTRWTQPGSVCIEGDSVYVSWLDHRLGNAEVFMNRSTDGGLTWIGERRVPKGVVPGAGQVCIWRMAVAPDPGGGADHLYFLFNTEHPSGAYDDLFLVSSHTAGASFGPITRVPAFPAGSGPDVDEIELGLTAFDEVHMAWKDDRLSSGNDVWYQRSDGVSLSFPLDAHLNSTAPGGVLFGGIVMGVHGTDVLVAWDDYRSGGAAEIFYNFSSSRGASWLPSGEQTMGGYSHGVDSVLLGGAHVYNGLLYITWADNRTGSNQVSVADTTASAAGSGTSWTERQLSTGTSNYLPRIGGRDHMAVTWWKGGGFRQVEASASVDAGTTWSTTITVANPTGHNTDHVMNFNPEQPNFVFAWLNDTSGLDHVYAGGFQTLYDRYCISTATSLGSPALIYAKGRASVSAPPPSLELLAEPVPNQLYLFFRGMIRTTGTTFGDGFLCVAGSVARLHVPRLATGNQATLDVNVSTVPLGTWHFQCWFRDPAAGGTGHNLSDAMSIEIVP